MECKGDCKSIVNINKKLDKMDEKILELTSKVANVEKEKAVSDEQIKMVFKILNEIKDTIRDMNVSLDKRLDLLERSPGEKWEKLSMAIIIAIATGIIGILIGKGGF